MLFLIPQVSQLYINSLPSPGVCVLFVVCHVCMLHDNESGRPSEPKDTCMPCAKHAFASRPGSGVPLYQLTVKPTRDHCSRCRFVQTLLQQQDVYLQSLAANTHKLSSCITRICMLLLGMQFAPRADDSTCSLLQCQPRKWDVGSELQKCHESNAC